MAYVDPTPADLKARFPGFVTTPDAAVQGALDEAAGRVDTSWLEADYRIARMLYAAHVLTMDGLGSSTETQLMGFRRIKVSSLELEREPGPSATAAALTSTSYGRRFLELAGLNFRGPVLV